MAVSSKGALSFKVIAPVGKGEQLMVCGDAPFLGGGDPKKAYPLFTTPADYPLWFSKEDLPRPAGGKTAHEFRYCVYRGGRFFRWDAAEKPRVIRISETPQIARDTLDQQPKPDPDSEDSDGVGCGQQEESSPLMVVGSRRPPGARGLGGSTTPHPHDQLQHQPPQQPQKAQHDRVVAGMVPGTAPGPTSGRAASADIPAGSAGPVATAGGAGAHGGRPLEVPSLTASKAAATAGALLQPSPAAGGDANENEEEDKYSVSSLQMGALELSRRQRQQQQREEGHGGDIGEVVGGRLGRPPLLEAEDGEGDGLGLGLRLGLEALSSPPPMRTPTEKACPPLWSSRDGGVVVASFYLPVILTKRPTAGLRSPSPSSRSTSGETAGVAAAEIGDTGACDCTHGTDCDGWVAEWDHEQLIALQTNLRVVRVGTVKCDHPIGEEDKPAVVKALMKLNCVPVFLTKSLTQQCYHGYCKGVLWPVLHGMLGLYDDKAECPNSNSLLDNEATAQGWQAYKQVNRAFRDKVVEVFHDGDMIWIHGFHLAILPAFLDRTVKVARIGLFLHTPFPPNEVFRALPHREDLLRGMLGADQVGFHRFSDSRHFKSCCRRLLGLRHLHNPETGLAQIVHGGKATILTDRHAGIDPDAVRASLGEELSREEVARLKDLHGDRIVVAGIESVEKIKGVWLKMLAFEDMLRRHPHLVGRVSMHEVGIANPARVNDYRACQESLHELVGRMNAKHGAGTVMYEERDADDFPLTRRAALMSMSSVFVQTPVHNGLSTMPIEFRVAQEHRRVEARGNASGAGSAVSPGVLILSEAVSCASALRGSFTVNPWQVEAVADAMTDAIMADAGDRTAWHEEDVDWCTSNTTATWAADVLGVLTMVQKESRSRYATTGLGLTSRVVGMDPTFKRVDTNCARRAYGLSNQRVFFLDYGGTLVKDNPTAHTQVTNGRAVFDSRRSKAPRLRPGGAVLEGLTELCRDAGNTVFVVSGRGKDELQAAFGHIQGLGLAAEHGSFFRWPSPSGTSRNDREVGTVNVSGGGWEALHPDVMDTAWKAVTRRFMQNFQIHTHGSYIEEKDNAMLWHYGDAEPEFGAMQAKQLQDELTDVLRFSGAGNANAIVEDVLLAGTAGGPAAIGGGNSSINKTINMNTNVSKTITMNVNLGATALSGITGSTRSNSVASEELGAIEIIHEEGLNSDAGGGGAYLEVRARAASKGNFVHMVLGRLGWPSEGACSSTAIAAQTGNTGGRFCLCVGDDVSDEDMFIAVKSYERPANPKEPCSIAYSGAATAPPHMAGLAKGVAPAPTATVSSGKENLTPALDLEHQQTMRKQQQQQQQDYLLTVTVGSKPSDADAWLPGVDAVVSLLRMLGRATSRHGTLQRSKLAPHAAALAISDTPPQEIQGSQSLSPIHTYRSASASIADASAAAPAATVKDRMFKSGSALGVGVFDTNPEASTAVAVQAMNVGQGMPVVRRHSYTIGAKPRISLSLGEFLLAVGQPEPEPPSF